MGSTALQFIFSFHVLQSHVLHSVKVSSNIVQVVECGWKSSTPNCSPIRHFTTYRDEGGAVVSLTVTCPPESPTSPTPSSTNGWALTRDGDTQGCESGLMEGLTLTRRTGSKAPSSSILSIVPLCRVFGCGLFPEPARTATKGTEEESLRCPSGQVVSGIEVHSGGEGLSSAFIRCCPVPASFRIESRGNNGKVMDGEYWSTNPTLTCELEEAYVEREKVSSSSGSASLCDLCGGTELVERIEVGESTWGDEEVIAGLKETFLGLLTRGVKTSIRGGYENIRKFFPKPFNGGETALLSVGNGTTGGVVVLEGICTKRFLQRILKCCDYFTFYTKDVAPIAG